MEAMQRSKTLPIHNRNFWLLLCSICVLVMFTTIFKDEWLTSREPNLLFYVIVPTLTILSGVLGMFAISLFFRQAVPFLDFLAISLIVNTIMQLAENILKLVYYLLWEYPGILYIFLVIPGGFILMTAGLKRWTKLDLWLALLLTTVDFIIGLAVGIFLTEFISITTPGS